MSESTAVEETVGRGRPTNRSRNIEAVRASETAIVENFGALTDAALEMALGRKPEICRFHHLTLRCPHTKEVETEEGDIEVEYDCAVESRGFPSNERMIIYAIDRIAGKPAVAGAEKQIQADFVRKVARYVAEQFAAANKIDDGEERARAFALGMSGIWQYIELETS